VRAAAEAGLPDLGRPSIVLIVLDTMRADHLECAGTPMGGARGFTPTLDRLAARGTRFKNAYANAPWTLPSHASLFTGCEPHRHGQDNPALTGNPEEIRIDPRLALPGRFTTMAAAFRELGYQTLGISENPWVGPLTALDDGFGHFWELRQDGTSRAPFPPPQGKDLTCHKVTYLCRNFFDRFFHLGNPFLLFVNYMTCHLPYRPTWQFRRAFAPDVTLDELLELRSDTWLLRQREGRLGNAQTAQLRRLYLAAVAQADAAVAEVLDLLKERQLLDNTLCIVLSDHGECIGHHGFFDHHFNLFDDLLRVPLIVAHPKLQAPRVIETPVQLSDLLPTLLQLVGAGSLGTRLNLPGPLLPLGEDSRTPEGAARPLFFLLRRGSRVLVSLRDKLPPATIARLDRDLLGVKRGDAKAVLSSDGELTLFDTARDPEEKTNLAATHAETARALAALLGAHFGGSGIPIPEVRHEQR
jgi:arylsulfatase A-like enzyme